MKVLLLGEKAKLLESILAQAHCKTFQYNDKDIERLIEECDIDFIISFGYKHIVKSSVINTFRTRIINMHISYLPYNRGADPNLWSFLENTKKGVTIHALSEKLDSGDILLQKEVIFNGDETLKTSYDKLINEMVVLFQENVDGLLSGSIKAYPQNGPGSFHNSSDKEKYAYLYSMLGYDTKISDLVGKALHAN